MKVTRLIAPMVGLAVLTTLVGCNTVLPEVVRASGRTETKDFSISGFTRVQAAAAFEITVNRSDTYSVRVTADDNLWDVLDISESGGTLHLQTKPARSVINSHLKATVAMPSLTGLDLSGASRADVDGFSSGDAISFTLSGASRANIESMTMGRTTVDVSGASTISGEVQTDDISIEASGAGSVDLTGSGADVRIDGSGAARVDLDEFTAQTVSATLSGGAQSTVNTPRIDRANVSGGAHLRYVGSPTIGNVSTSGGGSISRK